MKSKFRSSLHGPRWHRVVFNQLLMMTEWHGRNVGLPVLASYYAVVFISTRNSQESCEKLYFSLFWFIAKCVPGNTMFVKILDCQNLTVEFFSCKMDSTCGVTSIFITNNRLYIIGDQRMKFCIVWQYQNF